MKQKFLLRWLCATILLLWSTSIWAYDFVTDGIYYNVVSSTDLTCEVTYSSTSYNTYSGSVAIPEEVTRSSDRKTYTVVGIGTHAFRNSSTSSANLTDVMIPTTVTYIGNYAFYNSAKLTSLTIPNSVTTIGNYAFYYCEALPSINIPNSVTSIGNNAFRYCTSFSEITIPSSVTSIGERAFLDCTNITKVTLEDGEETLAMTTSSSYTPFTSNSSSYASCPIETLYLGRNMSYTSPYAPFRGQTTLTSLTIGEKVTTIGGYEFYGCTNLTDITLEDGEDALTMAISSYYTPFTNCSAIKTLYLGRNLSYTDTYAPFRGKTKLSTLTIGDKVTSIGQYAFYGCTGLTGKLIIPSNVTSIGDRAFYNCSSLEDVTIEDGEESLTMTTSSSATPFTDCSALKTLYFGRNLSYTDTYAPFRGNTSLSSLVIGNKVTSIGQYEFSGCTSLEDVTIEDGEKTLTMSTSSSNRPFTNCPIETLYLGRDVSYDGSYSPFRENTYLTSLTIGDKVTSIDEYEFYGCTNLTGELVIPSSITEIGDRAFYSCSSIETLILEDGKEILTMATSSSNRPFTNCCFSTLHVGRDVTYSSSYSPFRDNTSLTTLTLGNTVTTICEYEFYYCTNMTGEVIIPNSVTEINQYAFYNCTHITALTFEDGEKTLTIANNSYSTVFYSCPIVALHLGRTVSYYSSYSPFRGNTSLTSLTIGDKVTSIGQYAFYGCSNIVGELAIPNEVSEIGNYAFYDCSGLNAVTISNEVSEIGNYAFYDCSGLNAVTIGDGATSIGSSAFRGCSSLEQINIPDNVVTIGSDAFRSCSAMKEATIGRGVNVLGGGAFESCTALERVNYNATDCSSSNSYVFYLCDNLSVFNIGDNVITIPTYLCRDCSAIKEIVIPNSVISIGDYSFENCSGITALTLGDNLSTTGMYSFYGCSAIKEVTIPKNITKLDIYTFGNCTSLQEVTYNATSCSSANTVFPSCPNLQKATIGDEVLLVPAFLFSSTSLTELYIGKSVVDIGNFAFFQCPDLKRVDYYPTDCSSVSSSPFMYSENLSIVNIGDNVRTIPEYLFSYCPAIKEIIIPNSVITIGQSAFNSCSALASVVIGNRVTEIGNYAFYDCLSLTSLTLGSRVEEIGRFAFAYCENLENIYSYNSEPPVCKSSVFDDVNKKTCMLCVPTGSKSDYSTADVWEEFYNIVEVDLPDGIETLTSNEAEHEAVGYYSIDGKLLNAPEKGINIVRYSDGTTKKILVK